MKKRRYLVSLKSLEKKSKASLLRLIMKHLKTTSKARLVKMAWEINKSKLPKLNVLFSKRKALPKRKTKRKKDLVAGVDYYKSFENTFGIKPKRKTKRKFSPKQLAAQRLFAKRARAGTLRKRR